MASPHSAPPDDLLFVAFNSRVVALHPDTGAIVWSWNAPAGSGHVAMLPRGNRLFVSVNGYTYALDARTGDTLWKNPLRGFGFGVASLATRDGAHSDMSAAAAAIARQSPRST